jgi:hypothetical protein
VKGAIERSAAKADNTLTKSDRKSNLKRNKAIEREVQRKAQAYDLGKAADEKFCYLDPGALNVKDPEATVKLAANPLN